MSYFDLLCTRKYFDVFLHYFNLFYEHKGQYKEKCYSRLINRYYSVRGAHLLNLINSDDHIDDVYQALAREFGMARIGLASIPGFKNSIRQQAHLRLLDRLSNYRMDDLASSAAIPTTLKYDLEQLFNGLDVTQPQVKTKLVAVSKTLHFLLPDLIMPVDNAIVLRFLHKGPIPEDVGNQFRLFIEVFEEYRKLAARLGLKQSNGDGKWWNQSVPKRIDNAIAGFWGIFGKGNLERIICGNIDMLLRFLGIP